MQITIKTRTPLWTGGVERKMDRIHETSLIGSLRWWYEAVVRGLGGSACDPSLHECPDKNDNRCDACEIFGTTGWRRRFRVEVVEDRTKPAWNPPPGTLNIRPPDRNRGWFLPPGRMGEVALCFTGDELTLDLLAALFLFLEKWGNLGAKPQLGYGVFEIVNRKDVQNQAQRYQWNVLGDRETNNDKPDLRRFGFLRYRFKPQKGAWWTYAPGMERVAARVQPIVTAFKTVPLAPVLKNEWRFHRWAGNRGDEKWMFGTPQWRPEDKKMYGSNNVAVGKKRTLSRQSSRRVETSRVRSKVSVSWAYLQDGGWELRSWAWLQKPEIAGVVWDLMRDENGWQAVIKGQGLIETRPIGVWREWSANEVAELLEDAK